MPGPVRVLLALILLFPCLAAPASTPPPYVISNVPEGARITIYSEYLPDPSGELTIDQVADGDSRHRFQPASRYLERLGLSNHPWWIRVAVRNELGNEQRFALQQGPRNYHGSAFYVPDGEGAYRTALPDEQFLHRTPVHIVELPPGETRVFYWRINPRGSLVYSLSLGTLPMAMGNDPFYALYWLLLGVMLTLAFYNGLVAVLRGGPSHGYHAGFLLSVAALLWFASGLLAEQPLVGRWLPQLEVLSILGAMFSACGVGRTFVHSRRHVPFLDRGMLLLSGLVLLFALSVPWLSPTVALTGAYGLALVAAALLVTLGFQAWQREVPLGALYFATSLLVGTPMVLACLALLGVLQNNLDMGLCVMIAVNLAGVMQAIGLRIQHQQRRSRRVEERRRQAVAEAMETTRRETLSRIGHDVRTPLSGILGMAELLEDTPLTPNQKECLSGIRHSGDSLLKIINDVLEYSQLSTQGTEINREPLDLNEVLMDSMDLFHERAEEKQVELIIHVHTNLPPRVQGDPGRLRQVLTNLTGAFIRHGHAGELIIDVALEPTGRASQVRFEFSGTALRPDTLRGLRDQTGRRDSSSLNLSIAEQLVEVMEGRFGDRTEHGETFYWFVLPLPAAEEPHPEPDTQHELLQGRSMLVVDDSSTVTRVIRHLALSWGMRVTACHDPREALASLRTQANINEPYDVVLLDHHMPGMDGLELAARIHEDAVIIHPTTVVMLSGVNSAPTTNTARNVGIHRVLSKPVSAPVLRQVLAEEMGLRPLSPAPVTRETPDPNLKLLVVEDHKLSQKVIRGMLHKLGLKADLAANGREALELCHHRLYDLILMDCEMPEMDGFEATRRIREYERHQGLAPVPIIALTAHILREHRERSLAAGMNAHIPKPVEMDMLREILVRFTGTRRQRRNRTTPDPE